MHWPGKSNPLNLSRVSKDFCIARYKSKLNRRMPIVSPIFQARDVRGRHKISGNASGPTEQIARTIKGVRKYHGWLFVSTDARLAPFRNSPQCLHLIASS